MEYIVTLPHLKSLFQMRLLALVLIGLMNELLNYGKRSRNKFNLVINYLYLRSSSMTALHPE